MHLLQVAALIPHTIAILQRVTTMIGYDYMGEQNGFRVAVFKIEVL